MKIKSVQYPEGCQLKGWRKMVFERRLGQSLGSFFSVCDLDRCRAEILGLGPDKERYEELQLFHCESFKKMSYGEVQALVDKTAEYVGVQISIKRTNQVPNVVAALIVGILMGAAGGWLVPELKAHAHVATPLSAGGLAGETGPSPAFPGVRTPTLPLAQEPESLQPLTLEPEPVFNTKVRTDRPGAASKTERRCQTARS